jgi:hypothetical protein
MRLILLGFVIASLPSLAAPKKQARKKAAAVKRAAVKSDLQTDVRFDDSAVHGQYQVPEEALAKVENEKGLNDLLGVRKHFKDRLLESAEQE